LYALHHQGRPPLFVVDFRITPSRARRTLQPTNRNKVGLTLDEALQQWQQHFAKDPNAMDLTPGHMHARGALTDNEIARLHQEGKCFKCKHQGHIGHNCPNQNSQARTTNTSTASSGPTNATNTSTASSGPSNAPNPSASIRKTITAQEQVELVWDMDQGEKDKVIQDIFMQEDLATALT
jgi:hypothetical protein